MNPSVQSAVATFGAQAKAKLANPAASGNPEDQLRAPFEQLLGDFAALATLPRKTAITDLKTRPDYAVTVRRALTGHVELKAPGKGADPRRFRDPHDRAQWEKLQSLPNLLYTDGNEFSLWQNGELVGAVIRLTGDIETSGSQLAAPAGFASPALTDRFKQHASLGSPAVTLANPATGTGTFRLGMLRKTTGTIAANEGTGFCKSHSGVAFHRVAHPQSDHEYDHRRSSRRSSSASLFGWRRRACGSRRLGPCGSRRRRSRGPSFTCIFRRTTFRDTGGGATAH